MTGGFISMLGMLLLLMYTTSKLMDFYGNTSKEYLNYFAFYLFLLLSYVVLPKKYNKIVID